MLRVCLVLALVTLAPAARAQLETPRGVTLEVVARKWAGDLDGMVERQIIRVLTPYNHTHYFVDEGQQRGLVYDGAIEIEKLVNAKYKTGTRKVHVVIIPTTRDRLLPGLLDGTGDVAAAGLTITPERQAQADFGPPTFTNVSEIVVTSPDAPALASLDDLGGKAVFVRKSSSYWASLEALNARLAQEGKPKVKLESAPESLEDEDLLEMANAGLVQFVVVDDYLAKFWKQILGKLVVREDLALRSGASLAPAFRKNSPKLAALFEESKKQLGAKSAFVNEKTRNYLKQTKYVKNATSPEELNHFLELVKHFRKYGDQYKLDWLMMVAQGFQESRLNQNAKSHVGAIGVMQVMPATGKELAVGDIKQTENNIHAGIKYMRYMIDQYYKDEPMTELDKTLFAFASYNCGPGRMRQLRAEAKKLGLDPNVWFGSVSRVAAKRIGRETVTYVANIYKYAIAYQLVMQQMQERGKAKRESAE